MSSQDGRKRESQLVAETVTKDTDFLRVLVNDSSRKITQLNFVASIQQTLIDIGFLTDSTVGGGLYSRLSVDQFDVDHLIDASTEAVLLADLTAGVDRTFTLPAMVDVYDVANGVGQSFTIKIAIPNGGTKIVVATTGSPLVDGSATIDLTGPNLVSATFVPDGTDWWVIGG